MNEKVEKVNKVVQEMVEILLSSSTDSYIEIKFTLLLKEGNGAKLNNYLNKLFAFTDKNRPLQIEMK